MAMRAIPATNPENKGGVSSFRGDDEAEEDEANRKTINIKLDCKTLLRRALRAAFGVRAGILLTPVRFSEWRKCPVSATPRGAMCITN